MGLPINQVLCGDAAELMRGLPDASIHAIVTDPPYGLEFMGEEWDKFKDEGIGISKPGIYKCNLFDWKSPTEYKLPQQTLTGNVKCKKCSKWKLSSNPCKCESPEFPNIRLKSMEIYQSWTTAWAREALRVLLPGASMLVMGGTRTYHRMACGVEDAGFEVKDTILWCYNSGFPKAQDLGKLIDKRNERNWRPEVKDYLNAKRNEKGLSFNQINEILGAATSGGGTASDLMGDKRFSKLPTRYIYNKLKVILDLDDRFDELIEREEAEREVVGLGKGAGTEGNTFPLAHEFNLTAPATPLAREWDGWKVGGLKPSYEPIVWAIKPPEGSTTENVLKHGVGAINIDACRIPFEGDYKSGSWEGKQLSSIGYGGTEPTGFQTEMNERGRYPANMVRTDKFGDGYDRFYFVPKAERAERWFKCQICDVYQDGTHLRSHGPHALHCHDCSIDFPNTEEEKEVHKNHRTESNIVSHPTVKPVALGEFLIKLVTREGQIVLDQFCGLGSFLVAARNSNRQYIGFDNGSEYYEIARRRLAAIPPPLEAFA